MSRTPVSRRRRAARIAALVAVGLLMGLGPLPKATAFSFQRISGEGSSWAANAIDAMRVNVKQYGITVDYARTGSTAGRRAFLDGNVDFAASDIPFQFHPQDGSAEEKPTAGTYAYIPVTAGGTSFMYNLVINGQRVTNLRLSGENVSKIFTGIITMWNDPAIQADNPGLVMPARTVVPVVRSDGSGSSAQFSLWMINQYPDLWNDFCNRSGKAPACGETSFYPALPGMISQAGDDGVAGYVSQGFAEGAIGYVNYSFALSTAFPVVKVLNKAGYYTEPTPENVAVSLLQAQINDNAADPTVYLTQKLEGVYNDTDPRNYPLSSYSYLIIPTVVAGQFNLAKGETLGAFAYHAMCESQQQSASLGYSPMPINLVEASFDQIRRIPGVDLPKIDIAVCNNPTFSPDGSNLLANNAPQPQLCDKKSAYQCPDGTAGMSDVSTAISAAATLVVGAAPSDPGVASGPGAAAGDGGSGSAADPAPAAGSSNGSGKGTGSGAAATPGAGATTTTVVAGANAAASGNGTASAENTQTCDAATGTCQEATDAPTQAGAAAAVVGAVLPTTIGQSSGWNTSLALMILVIVLTLALVLAPAAFWRYLSNKEPAT